MFEHNELIMKPNLLFFCRHCLTILISGLLISACKEEDKMQYFTIDQDASAMEWKGFLKDDSGNNGTVKLIGKLSANDKGEITGGEIKLPLATLVNINLPTDALKEQLIHHLQSTDFFNMSMYPEIGFKINSMSPNENQPGAYLATGELTMLGKTNPVSFPVTVNNVGNKLEIIGKTTIDRTLWGMDYATDENAPDGMYIKPGIDVQLKLIAVRN